MTQKKQEKGIKIKKNNKRQLNLALNGEKRSADCNIIVKTQKLERCHIIEYRIKYKESIQC